MNFLSSPVWLLGGLPGGETFLRLRMLLRARVRTNAPNRESTRRSALVSAASTRCESKNRPLAWSILKPQLIMAARTSGPPRW